MKLRKSQEQDTTATGGAVIADRFKLDADENVGASSSGGVGTTIAVVCSLLGIALLGTTAWLIYQNLELIANA